MGIGEGLLGQWADPSAAGLPYASCGTRLVEMDLGSLVSNLEAS